MYSFNYSIKNDFKTIEAFLKSYHLGNEKIKQLKKPGHILLNDLVVNINNELKVNDKLTLLLDEEESIKPFHKKIDIVYEDDSLLVINKEAFVAIHSDGALYQDNTLSNMVKAYYDKKGYHLPVWYLHRLDFETTGLIIFVKDPLAMSKLSEKLSHHEIDRQYLALVSGKVTNDFSVDKPIGRDRHQNGKYRVSPTGKEAKTYAKVINTFKKYTMLQLKLTTGRTHQIRVHMQYSGHPLLGDILYGGSHTLIKRHALHSAYLTFTHPHTSKVIKLEAKLPLDMKTLIQK